MWCTVARWYADEELAALLREADAVSALTAPLARAAGRRCARRPAVIGNGVGPEWTPGGRREQELVVAAGRLAPYKGIDLLLVAFAALAEARPAARLVVCGRDYQRGHHARLARALGLGARDLRRRRRPGAAALAPEPRARLRFSVAAGDLGMALVEALASGAPCLSARVGAAAGLAATAATPGWCLRADVRRSRAAFSVSGTTAP